MNLVPETVPGRPSRCPQREEADPLVEKWHELRGERVPARERHSRPDRERVRKLNRILNLEVRDQDDPHAPPLAAARSLKATRRKALAQKPKGHVPIGVSGIASRLCRDGEFRRVEP